MITTGTARLKEELVQKPAGENADEAIFVNCLADTLSDAVSETGQGNGRSGTGKFQKGLVQTDATENHTGNHIGHQNPGGRKFGFVYEQLTNHAQKSAGHKSFQILHSYPSPAEMASA